MSCCCCCCLIHCCIQFVVLSFILSLLSYSLSHSIWLLLKTFSTTNLDTLLIRVKIWFYSHPLFKFLVRCISTRNISFFKNKNKQSAFLLILEHKMSFFSWNAALLLDYLCLTLCIHLVNVLPYFLSDVIILVIV